MDFAILLYIKCRLCVSKDAHFAHWPTKSKPHYLLAHSQSLTRLMTNFSQALDRSATGHYERAAGMLMKPIILLSDNP